MVALHEAEAARQAAEEADARAQALIEHTVRAVIGEQRRVASESIDMDQPLATPRLGAKASDVAEIVRKIEERLGIRIADEYVNKLAELTKADTTQLTPAQLVRLARRAQVKVKR